MTLMLVVLAVLGAGFVVVLALGRFPRAGEQTPPRQSDAGGDKPEAGEHQPADSPAASDESPDDDGALARRWKRGEVPLVRGLVEPAQNLPPVLLPADPAPDDVDRIRFSAGLRGYRMDQVDEVLDILRDTMAAKDRRLAELEAVLAELEARPVDADQRRRDGEAGGQDTGARWHDGEARWHDAETGRPDSSTH